MSFSARPSSFSRTSSDTLTGMGDLERNKATVIIIIIIIIIIIH